jgi:hypothetical protein
MNWRSLLLVGASALLTVASNLMLREGVTRAGGFALSLQRVLSDLLGLARQPLFVAGFVLYGTAAVVWFRVVSTEDLSTCYPLLVDLNFMLVTLAPRCCSASP